MELIDRGMGDCQVQSISWLPNQEDIQIEFSLTKELIEIYKQESISMHFTWASNLKIEMGFGDYIGMGLIWEVNFMKQLNNSWNVSIEFGGTPKGAISFWLQFVQIS